MCSNYPGIKLELALGTQVDKNKHLSSYAHDLKNRSFHVVERTRTSTKCQKMKYALAKRAKILFFTVICKFEGSSSWLVKLPNYYWKTKHHLMICFQLIGQPVLIGGTMGTCR